MVECSSGSGSSVKKGKAICRVKVGRVGIERIEEAWLVAIHLESTRLSCCDWCHDNSVLTPAHMLVIFAGNALYHYKRAEHQQQQQKLQGVTMA